MNQYQQLFRLDNKVAVVTGGAGILGHAFCKALCALGATVVSLDVQAEPLREGVNAIGDQFGHKKIAGFLCDVSDEENVNTVIAKIVKQFSKIDILLNNAATKTKELNSFFSPFTEYSLAAWREVMSVNLDGMFLMAKAVGKQMVKQKQGVIIQIASIYGLMAPDQRIYQGSNYLGREINTPAVYTASKAGVIGLTKHLATLWGEYGIRVNALCPGGVSSGQNEAFYKKYAARVPMGRMAKEIDIVGPMLFLASDASSYMTGQILSVDGGLSAW